MFNIFDELPLSRFNRDFYESSKYKVYPKEEYDLIVANTLGVSEEDLALELKEDVLTLKGATTVEMTGVKNSINYSWVLKLETIKSIDMEVADGYTYIYLNKNVEPKRTIAINRK